MIRRRSAGRATLPWMLVTASGLWAALPVHAQGPELIYRVPAEARCPSREAFVDMVRARLGHAPFEETRSESDPDPVDTASVDSVDAADPLREVLDPIDRRLAPPPGPPTLSVEVLESERGFSAEVVWREPDGAVRGRRQLEGVDCGSLADTLAVVSALTVEAIELEAQAAERREPRVIVRVVERDPEEPPALQPVAPPPPAPPVLARFTGSVAAGYGPSPLPHADFSLGGGLRYDQLGVMLSAHYADTFAAGEVEGAATLRVRLIRARLAGCWIPAPLMLCASGSLGMIEGEPGNVLAPQIGRALVGAAGILVGAVVMLDEHVGLDVHAELGALLPEIQFEVGDAIIWATSPIIGQLHVSFVAEL